MRVALTRNELLIGARLGAYEIVRHIGQGATSSVFEARHVALEKMVAVKILHEHLTSLPQIRGRFLREGRVAAQLRHPNALDVMDVGEERGVAYLVMDLLEGRDLKAHLAEHAPLPLEEAIAIVLPIASALAHAHALGAVHRDLKPGNVFLAEDVRGETMPMLVDFGLSKLDGVTDERPLSESDVVAGTVSYMAPEQTYGVSHAGPAADQFSLALILYECIVGRLPFAATTFYQLIEEIRRAVVKPPSAAAIDVPAAIDPIVLRALSRDPDKRWPGVRAFAAELLPFADEITRAAWRRDFTDVPRPASASRPRTPVAKAIEHAKETLAAAPHENPPMESPAAPPLPIPAGSSPFRTKGFAYRGFLLLADRALAGGLASMYAALDPALRDFARQPFLASGFYDMLPIYPLHVTLARLLGEPLDRLVIRAARGQATYDAKTIFSRMVQAITPSELPSRIERYAAARYYDFGPYEARLDGERAMILRHSGVPEYVLPWYAPMQCAYFEELMRALGAHDATGERLPLERTGTVAGIPVVCAAARIAWSA